jgi:hypothetical protein
MACPEDEKSIDAPYESIRLNCGKAAPEDIPKTSVSGAKMFKKVPGKIRYYSDSEPASPTLRLCSAELPTVQTASDGERSAERNHVSEPVTADPRAMISLALACKRIRSTSKGTTTLQELGGETECWLQESVCQAVEEGPFSPGSTSTKDHSEGCNRPTRCQVCLHLPCREVSQQIAKQDKAEVHRKRLGSTPLEQLQLSNWMGNPQDKPDGSREQCDEGQQTRCRRIAKAMHSGELRKRCYIAPIELAWHASSGDMQDDKCLLDSDDDMWSKHKIYPTERDHHPQDIDEEPEEPVEEDLLNTDTLSKCFSQRERDQGNLSPKLAKGIRHGLGKDSRALMKSLMAWEP